MKAGAIPLVIGGWPTMRPLTRAENVPARANENIEEIRRNATG